MQVFVLVLLLKFFSYSHAAEIISSCENGREVPGQFLLITKSPGSIQSKINSLQPLNHNSLQKIGGKSTAIFFLDNNKNNLLEDFKNDPSILAIEKNCYFSTFSLPNDPDLSKNTAYPMINLEKAWNYSTSSSVVIAVPDMGIQTNHPDLSANIWQNQAEVTGQPGVDDDINGYIDDFNGWGFPESNNDVTPGDFEGAEHGTHVAGIIGAVGNNKIGTSGILWNTKIMPLRIFSKKSDSATTDSIIKAIYYAVDNGAKIINCSWGKQDTPTAAELTAYNYAEQNGVFVVAAGGNEAIDISLFSPASVENVFAVGSINSRFELSSFSSFGLKIGALAPGGDEKNQFGFGLDEEIFSTTTNSEYGYRKGTSVSAPFVSGVAGLVKSYLPKISPKEMSRLLKEAGDKTTIRSNGNDFEYSILNAEKTISMAKQAAENNPNCTDACTFSAAVDSIQNGENPLKISSTSFGGGCSIGSKNTKNASSSVWDLLFLLSFTMPNIYNWLRNVNKK